MKKFKEYIKEVAMIDWGSDLKRKRITELPNNGSVIKDIDKKIGSLTSEYGDKLNLKKLFTIQNNFDVYISRGTKKFVVFDKNQQRFTFFLSYNDAKNAKTISIAVLMTSSYNKLHADVFYHELIKRDYILTTSMQSEGGQFVWSKLAKYPDVGIHGWYKGKPVNVSLSKDYDEIYLDYENNELKKGSKHDTVGMELVAYKK